MASKIRETHNLTIEGILNIDGTTNRMYIEVEQLGSKALDDLALKFNGELVKITFTKKEELNE